MKDLKDSCLSKEKEVKHSAEGMPCAMAHGQGCGDPRELKHEVEFCWSPERALNARLHAEGPGEILRGLRLPSGWGGSQVCCIQ